MGRRVLSAIMIVNVLAFLIQADYTYGKNNTQHEINKQEAVDIAEDFMKESSGDIQENFDKEITPMYDEEDNVSAYMVTFDKNEKQKGYAVVDVKDYKGQVIEYSYGDDNFVEEAVDAFYQTKKEKKNAKVYYLGGVTYAFKTKDRKNKDIFVDIGISEGQDNDMDVTDFLVGSETPTDKHIITNPEDYVPKNPKLKKVYNVPGSLNSKNAYKYYNTAGDFGGGVICGPVAAVNLFQHWSDYQPFSYGKLRNSSWDNTFNEMYLLAKTGKTGTKPSNLTKAIDIYCRARNVKCRTALHQDEKKGAKVIAELNNRRPCLFYVSDHKCYGNHAMLALGYEKYVYNKGKSEVTDNYIRVADGQGACSNRFVWAGYGGNLCYTSVALSTK